MKIGVTVTEPTPRVSENRSVGFTEGSRRFSTKHYNGLFTMVLCLD